MRLRLIQALIAWCFGRECGHPLHAGVSIRIALDTDGVR